MNPLTLKSINLKNIYLFWVKKSLHTFPWLFITFPRFFFLLLAVRDFFNHLPQWRVWQMRESYHLTSESVIRLQLYSKLAMFLEIFCTKERWKQSKQEVLKQTVRYLNKLGIICQYTKEYFSRLLKPASVLIILIIIIGDQKFVLRIETNCYSNWEVVILQGLQLH